MILHSRADDVISFGDSAELVKHSGLPASALIEIGVDHRLDAIHPALPVPCSLGRSA